MPGLGKQLRTIREEKGLTLEDAGEQLNIKCEDLKALEEEDFSFFPDRQFSWTVFEIYATFLGMNKEDVRWEFNNIWPEYGPLKSLFKKPKKRTKEILATETAEIREIPVIPEIPEIPREPEAAMAQESGDLGNTHRPGEIVDLQEPEEELKTPSKKKFPIATVASILVLAIVVFGVWKFVPFGDTGNAPENGSVVQAEGEGEQPEQTPATELEEPEGNIIEDLPPPAIEPDEVTTEIVEKGGISVTVTTPDGECWVEVYADGEQIYYRLVPPDTKPLTFEAEEELSVLIGDAAAAKLNVNGEDLGSLGARYVVIQKVFTSEQ